MTLSPERSKHITASDAAAVLGIDPYRSAWEVWANKTGRLEPSPETEAMRWGTRLEPVMVAECADRLNCRVTDTQVWLARGNIGATLDATTDQPAAIEAKTAGIVGRPDMDQWGEEGTDQVPPNYVVQAHVQMYVSGLEVVWLPVLIGASGFRLYRIGLDAELREQVVDRLENFWRRNVEADTPPDTAGEPPSLDVLRRLRRVPDSRCPVDPAAVEAWREARELRLAAAKVEDCRAAELAMAMGHCEAGECPGPDGEPMLVWWREESAGKRLDMKALEAAHPGLLDGFRIESTRRVWRVMKGA